MKPALASARCVRLFRLWQALDLIARTFEVRWEKQKGKFLWLRSDRVLFAQIDRLDLLDTRTPAPLRIPGQNATGSGSGWVVWKTNVPSATSTVMALPSSTEPC